MVNKIINNSILISPKTVRQNKGMVILSLREYKQLLEKAVPAYYLKGKEAKELDKLVEEGLREFQEGKCKTIKSLSDLE